MVLSLTILNYFISRILFIASITSFSLCFSSSSSS